MPTPQEEQDRSYANIGFHVDGDYEVPAFTNEEFIALLNLRECARNEKIKDAFLEKLAKANVPYEVMMVYRFDEEKFKGLVGRLINAGKTGLPEDNLFRRLKSWKKYESLISFIFKDGGEIREGAAFESDGSTIKKGFRRLYWK